MASTLKKAKSNTGQLTESRIEEIQLPSFHAPGMSDHDRWLLDTPEVLASVKQGLADSAAGRVSKRQSYAEYADDILED